MKQLINEFKSEHKAILDVLDQVKALGIATRTGQDKLLAARDLLIAHVHKEDARYYPELKKAAKESSELKIMMDYFISDMEAVSKKAMQVFDKYSQGGDEAEFAREIKLLYAMLKDRILTEETTLFKKFQG